MVDFWKDSLKKVPWKDVMENAPAIAEGAKKLWRSVAGQAPAAPQAAPPPPPQAQAVVIDPVEQLAARVDASEKSIEELHGQVVASSKLLSELALQNRDLIARVEADRKRLLQLAWAAGAGVVLGLTSLILALRLN